MASSVYSEVTSVSTSGYERDRVLDSLKKPALNLPYTVEDITISHNDFAVADVYNDSIKKLYSNYLYLIANAEILSNTAPTSSADNYITVQNSGIAVLSAVSIDPNASGSTTNITGTFSLSNLQETHFTLKTDETDKFVLFNYSPDQSFVVESDTNITNITTLLSSNEVEFNKTFKFKNIVSVDIIDNFLFVLDKDANTAFKFDISGLITDDPALKKTSAADLTHPGRYLLKTIGGEGISQTKNKLSRPESLSIYKDRIYILDNGHTSLKVFDLNFNFIQEISSPNLFNNPNTGELVSIVVDQYSDTNELIFGYILSSKGKILEYNVEENTLSQPQNLFNFYDTRLYTLSGLDEGNSFKKIVNSKSQKNILYICNNGKIYKYYKSNLNQYLGVLNLSGGNTGIKISGIEGDQQIMSFDTALYNGIDYIAVTTKVNSPTNNKNLISTYIYQDEHTTTKLYSENLYTNYFTLSDILVLPQEVVNNISFNKTTKKIIYNHYSLFENLNKKVYSFYSTDKGSAAVPTLCSVNSHTFTKPSSFEDSNNLYIGVNEPLLTDVINRPLKLLYSQQESLFNLIKEHTLNTDPPSDIPVYLPANTADFPNVIELSAATATVASGSAIACHVTRTNLLSTKPSCSFKYYTTALPAVTSNFTYIPSTDKHIAVFDKNETEHTIYISTTRFFGGDSITFNLVIEQNTNCVVDPDKTKTTVSITPEGTMYGIELSAATLDMEEGSTGRIAITRSPVLGNTIDHIDLDTDASVNINIKPSNSISTDNYIPNIPGSSDYNVVNSKTQDFVAVSGSTNPYQVSAKEVNSTSTIFFTESITSVVFDISAVNTLSDNSNSFLDITISNPSEGSALSGTTSQTVYINQDYKTATLFLSAISGALGDYGAGYRADTNSDTLLSCVNIWQALSADSTYQEFSATNPFIVDFTINSPLSVFSVSTLSAAIQIWPTTDDIVYSTNKLHLNVEDGSALVGMGGQGGNGALWESGSDFSDDGDIVAHYHSGEAGGAAIGNLDTYFSTISVNNSGLIYGGAGGGAGGVLPISAETDASVQKLSAGGGGGGGAGIHTANRGSKGLAGVDDDDAQEANFRHVFVLDGSAGGTVGGAGGHFSTSVNGTNTSFPTINVGGGQSVLTFPMLSGLSGGDIGQPGFSNRVGDGNIGTVGTSVDDSFFVIQSNLAAVNSNVANVSALYSIREGGEAGYIVDSINQVLSTGSGTAVGDGSTLIDNS